MFLIFSLVTKVMWYAEHKDFLDEVTKQTNSNPNMEWIYVDKRTPSPDAKQIPIYDSKGNPFIVYKLVPGNRPYHLEEE